MPPIIDRATGEKGEEANALDSISLRYCSPLSDLLLNLPELLPGAPNDGSACLGYLLQAGQKGISDT